MPPLAPLSLRQLISTLGQSLRRGTAAVSHMLSAEGPYGGTAHKYCIFYWQGVFVLARVTGQIG